MKRIVIISLLLIYCSATIGATIHLHYCMNDFVGWSLSHGKQDNKCGRCGMKQKKEGCCKDEHKSFKLNSEHQLNKPVNLLPPEDVVVFPAAVNGSDYHSAKFLFFYPVNSSPPGVCKEPLFVLHSIFLI